MPDQPGSGIRSLGGFAETHRHREVQMQGKAIATAIVLTAFAAATTAPVSGQSLKIAGREIQIHGSIQQGAAKSGGNNFLTMATKDISFGMTDGAVNVSSQITRKLRAGFQVYSRNIGELGNGQIWLDWGYVDYRFHDAFGLRAGKVKTPIGLFNDTQDMEFLYTWALLPQAVYPTDLRAVTIAHVGGDAYGTIRLKKAGALNYTVYAGCVGADPKGGYQYGLEDGGMQYTRNLKSRNVGADLRWDTPIDGLMVGYSRLAARADSQVQMPVKLPFGTVMYTIEANLRDWNRDAIYGDYQVGPARFSAEWRQERFLMETKPQAFKAAPLTVRGWFVAGSYRLHPKLEVGSYYSHFINNVSKPVSNPDNHIFDKVVTARVDINQYWHLKVEGHFVDGYGSTSYAHGFYLRSNPQGFARKTNMLVVRTGLTF
jgi:hypothetical protein